MKIFVTLLRWIFMLPAAILTVIIVNYFYDYSTAQLGYGDLLIDLFNSNGFGGHYILLGPVYLLFRFAASFGLGLSVAMLIAPKYNLLVGYTLFMLLILGGIGMVIVFALQHSILPADYYIRASVEVLGQFIGFGGAILRMKSEKNNPLNRIFASTRENDGIKTNLDIQKIKISEKEPTIVNEIKEKTIDIKKTEVKFEDVKRIVNKTMGPSLIKDENIKNAEVKLEDVNKKKEMARKINLKLKSLSPDKRKEARKKLLKLIADREAKKKTLSEMYNKAIDEELKKYYEKNNEFSKLHTVKTSGPDRNIVQEIRNLEEEIVIENGKTLISKKQALEIALAVIPDLEDRYIHSISLEKPNRAYIFGGVPDDCWCIEYSRATKSPENMLLGPDAANFLRKYTGKVIFIDKFTGEVAYNGSIGR